MCGITGFLGASAQTSQDLSAQVRRMADAIAHRGPDSDGLWVDAERRVALGHRRLAVVDLSPQGAQPMVSPCGRYVVVYNGEIYNHLELRTELGALPWRGHSDTETLLAAFGRWGVLGSLPHLVGMFAIAVWDRQNHCLVLARDRMGEKPLYWGALPGGDLVFGSELKALRVHPRWQGDIDRQALALFMRHNAVPAPHSIHRGIHKLLPGAWVRLQAGQAPEQGRWWRLTEVAARGQAERALAQPWSDEEATDRLQALLLQSIRGQMLADVPLGAFVSGGVDSSTIVALMARAGGATPRTFSIGFDSPGFDESAHALAVATHLGTRHTELRVSAADALATIPRLPAMYDEPFADSSQVPTALLCALAREHVTVALSGDAGDELFAGYNRYWLADRVWRRLRHVPLPLRRVAAAALAGMPASALTAIAAPLQRLLPAHRRHGLVGQKLHKFARNVLPMASQTAMYRALVSHWQDPQALVIDGIEPASALDGVDLDAVGTDAVEAMGLLDQLTYLPDDILVKVDRAAMAASLEVRVPLLDHRIVDFAWHLPMRFKLRDGQTKWLLRQVLYRHVPRSLIERPKQGFSIPLAEWLRGPLRDWAEALLEPGRIAREGYLRPAPVRRAWEALLAGRPQADAQVWDLLMWQAWLENNRNA